MQILLLTLAGYGALCLAETMNFLPAKNGPDLLMAARVGLLAALLCLTHLTQGNYWCALYALAALLPLALPFSAVLAANAGAYRLRRSRVWPGWLAILCRGGVRSEDRPAKRAERQDEATPRT